MPTRFTLLGCGSSLGIPRIDGYFGKCNPKIKQNYTESSNNTVELIYNVSLGKKASIKKVGTRT